MRAVAFAALFALLGTAAATAQSPSMFDQYKAASAFWNNAPADMAAFETSYPKIVADHLTGKWFNIGMLQPTGADDTALAKSCVRGAFSVIAKDPFSFKMVRAAGTDFEYTTVFTAMGGNRYNMSTDAKEYAHALGEDKADPAVTLNSLRFVNGPSFVFRQSADILVVETTRGEINLFARCPS